MPSCSVRSRSRTSGCPTVTDSTGGNGGPNGSALPEDAMLPRDLNRSLPMALLRAREALMTGFRPLLQSRDLTEPQWRVMRVLSQEGPLDASDVASRANILAPSLTRIIRSLEERGLVTRERDTVDGRRTMLAITPAALDLIREIAPGASLLFKQIEADYGRERMEQLIDMLNDLARLRLEGL